MIIWLILPLNCLLVVDYFYKWSKITINTITVSFLPFCCLHSCFLLFEEKHSILHCLQYCLKPPFLTDRIIHWMYFIWTVFQNFYMLVFPSRMSSFAYKGSVLWNYSRSKTVKGSIFLRYNQIVLQFAFSEPICQHCIVSKDAFMHSYLSSVELNGM